MHQHNRARESLGQSDLVIITERVDDVALLIGQMVKMGVVEVLDRHLPRHSKQRRVSWGWTAVIWLRYPHRRGPPEGVGGSVHHRHAPHLEPPERPAHRAARFQ